MPWRQDVLVDFRGVVGKLSVGDDFSLGVLVRVLLFAANAVCTAQMWRYFLKALQHGSTPVCTILNTGTNFAVSGICGALLFGEAISALWLTGAAFILAGLTVIATDPTVSMT
eukprot:TRINITY_DN17109_c0_g1_i2.p3 TRINITY_DN17109_c0_g1~~TRINITY_DN17109_c0_g1_i2.p3  ORF type:complete len:113 (-),score=17.69 TRINITY_DN17109_c0_g1_i2:201-539(-)